LYQKIPFSIPGFDNAQHYYLYLKEHKGTSILRSFDLNFVLWSGGFSCEEVGTIAE
jgi:hypothetical protein